MKIILPLRVVMSGDKDDWILNLNNYRNAHYFTLNKAKKLYSKLVVAQLPPGNQALAGIAALDAEHARKLKALKKKHKAEPQMFEMLSPKLNNQHAALTKSMRESVKGLKTISVDKQVYLFYQYYHGNRGQVDVSNPCSIIDKFTADALTAAGIWEDDNVKTVVRSIYDWGGVDKDNPRCELSILVAPVQDLVLI